MVKLGEGLRGDFNHLKDLTPGPSPKMRGEN